MLFRSIEVAKNAGLQCEEDVLVELTRQDLNEENYKHYLSKEDLKVMEKEFKHLM